MKTFHAEAQRAAETQRRGATESPGPDRRSSGPVFCIRDLVFGDFSLNTTDLGRSVVDSCPEGARQTSPGQRPGRKGRYPPRIEP